MDEISKGMNLNSSLENVTSSISPRLVGSGYNLVDVVVGVQEAARHHTALFWINLINDTIICTFFSVFGVISNAINMVVFSKMGFKDSINMSLFVLAISDLGSCVFMLPVIVGLFPYMEDLGLPVHWQHFAHTVGGWPHTAFTKSTTLITAFIIFERCLCVSMPLKVKTIITRKRTKYFLVFSIFFVFGAMAPLFYSNQFGWIFLVEENRTILGRVDVREREDISKFVLPFINAFISIFAFIFIIVSTVVLVVTLKKQSEWRLGAAQVVKKSKTDASSNGNNSSSGSQNSKNVNSITTKEQSISRMVVIISTLFIATLFPSVAVLLVLWTDRRWALGGSLFYLFKTVAMVTHTFESLNAAINIFIYYGNSSNYKAMFDQTFRFKNDTKTKT